MRNYLNLLEQVLTQGKKRSNRTGVDTLSLFGAQTRYNLREGFPLVTTKKIHMKSVIYELLWFLSGDTHVNYLQENGVRIWNEWATEEQCAKFGREAGDLGPVYGHQWRNFGGKVDQIQRAIDLVKNNPESRRIIVTGWNPQECDQVALPPCHTLFQFYVENGELSCQLYQRSADIFLGVPFNIASYSLLTMMIAQVCDLKPGDFVHTFGDLHLYVNHLDQAKLQLSREPRDLPQMLLNPEVKNIFDFKYEDFKLVGYDPHPRIKAEVAV